MKPASLLVVLMLVGCQSPPGSGACGPVCKPNPFYQPCNNPYYCRGINECHSRLLARLQAKKSLWGCKASCDYRHGYEQAFVDIAMGASGEVPALAPINYWHDHSRSACGHAQADDWFAGYAAGASQAEMSRGPYNEVAKSMDPGYRTDFAHSLAPDCQN